MEELDRVEHSGLEASFANEAKWGTRLDDYIEGRINQDQLMAD